MNVIIDAVVEIETAQLHSGSRASSGVSDGDRTRDNRSHNPVLYH